MKSKPKIKSPSINKTKQHKKALIEAMTANLGIVTASCVQAKLSRGSFYTYYNTDPKFKKAIDDIADQALDYVEGKMFSLIENEDVASTLFYLKTKGKKRGYIERSETDITSKGEAINTDPFKMIRENSGITDKK